MGRGDELRDGARQTDVQVTEAGVVLCVVRGGWGREGGLS